MRELPPPIMRVIREFNRLPGIGSKTSERFVFHLLRRPTEEMEGLAQSLLHLQETIRSCSTCYTYTENETCDICANPVRHNGMICVVAEPRDVGAIEQTGEFNGVYHVLGGLIDHADGIGPDMLRIQELLTRTNETIEEIILATNPTMEGETTAMYLAQQLKNHNVRVTKIARGLPVGGDIEFADEVTLANSLQARQTVIQH